MVLPIDYLSCSTPKKIERWTEIEAKVMASEKKREKYLNHEFGIVDNEKLEIADITQTEKERACVKRMKPLVFSSNRKVNQKNRRTCFLRKRRSYSILSTRTYLSIRWTRTIYSCQLFGILFL